MTTKLEQEFYDTFGIEPKNVYWCKRFDETSIADCNGIKEPSKKCAKCENGYIKYRYYPPITDKVILELIIMYLQINNLYKYYPSIEDLKNDILKEFIVRGKNKIIKQQIQQLFKEE